MVAELLTTTQQHLQRVQASGRGAIWVERNKTIPQTLLHAQTRMALRASAEALRSAEEPAAADEVAALADERPFTSVGGALVYQPGTILPPHLDDNAACNSNPFHPCVVIWSFGNSVTFQWAPADFTDRPILRGEKHNCKFEARSPYKDVQLDHGDALLLNVERIAHGIKKVSSTCTDASAAQLLPGRRMCVPIRPQADKEVEAEHYRLRRLIEESSKKRK